MILIRLENNLGNTQSNNCLLKKHSCICGLKMKHIIDDYGDYVNVYSNSEIYITRYIPILYYDKVSIYMVIGKIMK